MISDEGAIYSSTDLYYYGDQIKARSPLTKAKKAIKAFVSDLDLSKDAVSVIGFSTSVDVSIKSTNNINSILQAVNEMEEEGYTAFYDAIMQSLVSFTPSDKQKVIVALTDGDDNASQSTLKQAIELAQKNEIPVYVIGLGNVNPSPLKKLANKTQGEFFYAKNSSDLLKIYKLINQRINALYELTYESVNLASADTIRSIYLDFDIDGMTTQQELKSYFMPTAVREKLQKIEVAKQEELVLQQNSSYPNALPIALFVLTGGGILYVLNKKKKKDDDDLRYT
jgi:Ca-activated chloride channel family protein